MFSSGFPGTPDKKTCCVVNVTFQTFTIKIMLQNVRNGDILSGIVVNRLFISTIHRYYYLLKDTSKYYRTPSVHPGLFQGNIRFVLRCSFVLYSVRLIHATPHSLLYYHHDSDAKRVPYIRM